MVFDTETATPRGDTPERDVGLTLDGRLTYKDQITVQQAAQIIAFLSSGSALAAPGSSGTHDTPLGQRHERDQRRTPVDALKQAGAQTNAERMAVFASLLQEAGSDPFQIDEMRNMFRSARQPAPANMSRDLDGAIRSGWISAEGPGTYFLTSSGYDAVDEGFANARSKRGSGSNGRSSSARKPRRTPLEIPEAFAELDTLPNEIDGAPAFNELKTDQDRFVWSLKLAKTLNLEGLDNKEVVWVTDVLGSAIESKQITSKYVGANKKGYVNKSLRSNKMRITVSGEAYLASLTAD